MGYKLIIILYAIIIFFYIKIYVNLGKYISIYANVNWMNYLQPSVALCTIKKTKIQLIIISNLIKFDKSLLSNS